MEALRLVSGVTTIVKLANDIAGAVKAASRNKKRCKKLAERVEGIGELLRVMGDGSSSSPSTAVATRRLVSRLEKALRRALLLVNPCQCQASSRIYSLVAGGWQADQLDKVNAEIDRCLLDLSLSSLALVSSIDHKLNAAAAAAADEPNTEVAPPLPPVQCIHGHDQDDGEDKMASGAAEKNDALICYGGQDGKTEMAAGEVTATIGVPAATAYMHYQLSPPFYGYQLHYYHCTHGHCHCAVGRYSPSYPWYSDDSVHFRPWHMFSDDNPNSCSIM
uniref:MCAfunc domain-containing protein n=1 Tax=Oryza punctata TaxID=4537 RepID=A0A0E0MI22_ORYPU